MNGSGGWNGGSHDCGFFTRTDIGDCLDREHFLSGFLLFLSFYKFHDVTTLWLLTNKQANPTCITYRDHESIFTSIVKFDTRSGETLYYDVLGEWICKNVSGHENERELSRSGYVGNGVSQERRHGAARKCGWEAMYSRFVS